MTTDHEHATCCGDDIDEADKLAVEAMPANYGADERDAELAKIEVTE
jgi:hypothetical protein